MPCFKPHGRCHSPTCESCEQSELRRGGWRGDARLGGLRAISVSRPTSTEPFEFRHRNCLDFTPLMPNAVSRKRIRRVFGSSSTKSRLVTCVLEIFSFVKSILLCLIMGFEEMAQGSGKSTSSESESPASEAWLCLAPAVGRWLVGLSLLLREHVLPCIVVLTCCRAVVRGRL